MKKSIYLLLIISNIFAQDSQLIDCNQIFNARKEELMREIDKIDEQQQALQALQSATQALLDKREEALKKKESDINATLLIINKKEKEIRGMLDENKKVLENIKAAKDDKIAEVYAKMKPSAAANIISAMPESQAAAVLFALSPKQIGAILPKIPSDKASILTDLIKKGPPFEYKAVDSAKEQIQKFEYKIDETADKVDKIDKLNLEFPKGKI